jgi:hypothetical protein
MMESFHRNLDRSLDEALCQCFADVLDEPIPERLLHTLQGRPDAGHAEAPPARRPGILRFQSPPRA